MSGRSTDSTLTLLSTALRQTSDHLRNVLELARVEIDGNLRALFGLLAPFVVCVLLIVAALGLFLGALVKALAAVIGSETWAAVVVAAPFLGVATVLSWVALRWMALPDRTVPPPEW